MTTALELLRLVGEVGSGLAVLLTAHTLLNVGLLRRPPPSETTGERVSVLLPVRDEEAVIAGCLAAIGATRGVPDLEVLVLDDGSTDTTAELVRAAADPRIRLITGAPLPDGWLGKPHACQQLAGAAGGSVLVFLDADVTLKPDGLARAVAVLRGTGLDLVAPHPRQCYAGFGQSLVQPLLQWSWLTLVPLRVAERTSRRSLAVANGQLLVCDATAYHRAGGHAAVRTAVIEDIALLRALISAGLHGTATDGTDLASARMYGSWSDLVAGYTKSLWAAGGSRTRSAGQVGFLALAYVAPLVGLAAGSWWCAAGYGAAVIGRLVTDRVTRAPANPAYALLHPLSVLLFGWLVARSWSARRRGTITWKGRSLFVATSGLANRVENPQPAVDDDHQRDQPGQRQP